MQAGIKSGNVIKIAGCLLSVWWLSGCSATTPNSFTLKTEMPAQFQLKGNAHYLPATGETCTAPPRKGRYAPSRNFFTSERQEIGHTAVFDIPLSRVEGGCPLVLKSLELELEGKYGPDRTHDSRDRAYISFRDAPTGDQETRINDRLYNGECQWWFRTMGPYRYLIKILNCRAVNNDGQVIKRPAGGNLERDQLSGKTINLSFKIAKKERPYFTGSWLETPNGWKACTGRWGSKNEEHCISPPKFIDFKMPDGTDCTIYPNCVEQGIIKADGD